MMLLAFDIGNTNIVVGAFDGESLLAELRLKTDPGRTTDEYAVSLLSLLERKLGPSANFDACIISSVVPPLTPDIARMVKEHFDVDAIVVGPGIKTGLSIKTSEPGSVGADRIVNAVAAKEIYGLPAIVVDFGTATSIDFVSASGSYEGGIIAPGPVIAMESLVRNTAKLPRIELSWPKSVIGKSTVAAMQAGSVVGYVCMVDGLISRMIAETCNVENVIATGGIGQLFSAHSERIRRYDPHLTLEGLRIVAALNA